MLRLPVRITFATAEGAFDEQWRVDLEATGPETATFSHGFEVRHLRGTWRPQTDTYADTFLEVQGWFAPEGPRGELRLVGMPADGGATDTWSVGAWSVDASREGR